MGTEPESEWLPWGHAQGMGGRSRQEDRYYLARCRPMGDTEAEEFMRRCVAHLNAATASHYFHGSTFTGAVVTRNGNVVTAHLGDSPAATFAYDPRTRTIEVSRLTVPHTPSSETQHFGKAGLRWRERGGRVEVPGVPGDIGINRALGDMQYGPAVSKEAEIALHDLTRHHASNKRVFLMVASDGIIKDHDLDGSLATFGEVLRNALSLKPHEPLSGHAARLVERSLRPRGDNVTVTLTEVQPGGGVFAAVCDGHGGARTAEVAVAELETFLRASRGAAPAAHLAQHSSTPANRLGHLGIAAAIALLGGWAAYEIARRRRARRTADSPSFDGR